MAARVYQPSLGSGIVSPELFGRIDIPRYSEGAKDILNMIINTRGGGKNRPGSIFTNPVKDSSLATVLIPFIFSTTQAYHLEFGDSYMRVVKDGGHVLESAKTITGATQADPVVVTTSGAHGYSNGDHVYISGVVGMTELNGRTYKIANASGTTFELTDWITGTDIDGTGFTAYSSAGEASKIYELATPWAAADLANLRWSQSNDVLTLTHNSYTTREITRTAHNAWTISEVDFAPEMAAPTTCAATAGGAGALVFKYKVTAVDADTGEESLAGTNSADAVNITAATQADPVQITVTGHPFSTGDEILVESVSGMTEINDRRFTVDYVDANNVTLRGENGTGHTAYSSGGTATPTQDRITAAAPSTAAPNVIAWTAAANASMYNIYKANDGNFYGYIGSSESLTFDDTNIEPDISDGPPKQRNPFDASGDYPAVSTYYEERQLFMNTTNKPQNLWMTRTGLFKNMSASQPLRDSDALEFALLSRKVHPIRDAIGFGGNLLVFTQGAEWALIQGDQPLSASNIPKRVPQTAYGAANLPVLEVGDAILFVQRSGEVVRDIRVALAADGGDAYTSGDMTVLANELFKNKQIVRWDYAFNPGSNIWAVQNDGSLLCFTFVKEHNVAAWTRHIFGGSYQHQDPECVSVSVIPGTQEEEVCFIVKRTINGTTVQTIEYLSSRRFDSVQDAHFVDCGASVDAPITITGITSADPVVVTTSGAHGLENGDLVDLSDIVAQDPADGYTSMETELNGKRFKVANKTSTTFELTSEEDDTGIDGALFSAYVKEGYARECFTTISGLWWLEGEEVAILANGSVEEPQTVSGGMVTINDPASRVHIGLGYTSEIETLPLGAVQVQGEKQSLGEIYIKIRESRGIKAGARGNLYDYVQDRDWDLPEGPIPPETALVRVPIDIEWDEEATVIIQQTDPIPLEILSFLLEVDGVGEKDEQRGD